MNIHKLKVAIVCDWLTTPGGAEKIILALHKLFPNAPIFTTIYDSERNPDFNNAKVITSGINNLPFAKKKHQLYLSLMPGAVEKFNLDDFDLVISSSHSCAKGIITKPDTLHISYCHSPMRYAWENSVNYIKKYDINPFIKWIAPWFIHKIRLWDRLSADRVDSFIANSHYVQNRIYKYYRKPSTVIHPFITSEYYDYSPAKKDYFLAVGRLTQYKQFDLLIDTFNKNGLKLKIIGTGASENRLKAKANANIEFLGYVSDDDLRNYYKFASALIFPQLEDFGIIPIEAMAMGCPVIAFGKGGAIETVQNENNGVFFKEQTVEQLQKAIDKHLKKKYKYSEISKHASNFSEERFQKELIAFIEKKWDKFTNK
ncbi:glycosyltransferase [Candidatus Peregrinibacteria bacterium]|nr:glycosyltransferase [Candidatus Peregrinibacteria bacterium]